MKQVNLIIFLWNLTVRGSDNDSINNNMLNVITFL